MPGVCGKVSPDAATPAELEPMLARMRHHDWYRVERHRAAGVALGSIGPGEIGGGLFLDGGGSRVAAIAGEIYDPERPRQRRAAQGPPLRTGGHAEICLRGYEAGGPGFFAAVHGKFVAAIWEPASR